MRTLAPLRPTRVEEASRSPAEVGARAALRAQIGRLERRLDPGHPAWSPGGGPQLLGLAELERIRDGLVEALARQSREAERQADAIHGSRLRLERMLAAPGRHRFARVTLAELGLPGCGAYASRPRLGL